MTHKPIAINPRDGFDLLAVWKKMAANGTYYNWSVLRKRSL